MKLRLSLAATCFLIALSGCTITLPIAGKIAGSGTKEVSSWRYPDLKMGTVVDITLVSKDVVLGRVAENEVSERTLLITTVNDGLSEVPYDDIGQLFVRKTGNRTAFASLILGVMIDLTIASIGTSSTTSSGEGWGW